MIIVVFFHLLLIPFFLLLLLFILLSLLLFITVSFTVRAGVKDLALRSVPSPTNSANQ
jgi:hypothetical protein